MAFVLLARTSGDELISPTTIVIAESSERRLLEELMTRRAMERSEWLKSNSLPWWARCQIIDEEVIQEVLTV